MWTKLRTPVVRAVKKTTLPTTPIKYVTPLVSNRTMSTCGAPECGTGGCVGSGSKVAPVPSSSKHHLSTLTQAVRTNPAVNTSFKNVTSSSVDQANLSFISSLVNSREPGYSLPQPFYTDPVTYAYDLKHIWNKSWLFAGYTCQLPNPGDYFTYEVGADSIIVIRSAPASETDSGIRAFHNSCRHRGSRIVTTTPDTKHVKRLVCPYHQWGYERDGSLVHARDMDSEFDKSQNGLHEVHVEEVEGLVFICLTPKHERPRWEFDQARALMAPQLAPHQLGSKAKIAFTEFYTIKANWKLVYENNRECYHCAVSHPEYVKSNYDLHLTYNKTADGKFERDLDPHYPGKEKVLAYINSRSKEWESLGFACSPDSSFPGDGWYRASRMPLKAGWVTESMDGQPVSTVMGRLPQRDMGSFRIHTLPNYWLHLSGDHGVSSRLTPLGPGLTEARVDWLVASDAVEGRDYHLDKMLPFWSKTSDQDWHLCEINMQGVSSSAYRPGRLSQRKEAGLDRFIGWYVDTLKTEVEREKKGQA